MLEAAQARGRMIVLDGVDGCGKSTQAELLVVRLEQDLDEVLHLREPGSTVLGEGLRTLLLETETEIGAPVEVLLFAAARRQLLEEIVEPALERGAWVVCERFHSSTFAYQGHAGGVGTKRVLGLLQEWTASTVPDLELILDIDPHSAQKRRPGAQDRIEARGMGYQERVAEGYRLYVQERAEARLVGADGAPEVVAERIWKEVQTVLA